MKEFFWVLVLAFTALLVIEALKALSHRFMETLTPVRRWRHYKTRALFTTYREVGRGTLQASTRLLVEGDRLVAYRSEADGKLWFRLESEFEDGRFEEIV